MNLAFRLLLRAYPRDLRDRYGEEMRWTFDARLREARRTGGRRAMARLAGRELTAAFQAAAAPLRAPRLTRGDQPMETLLQDIRYALRSLSRQRNLVVVVSLLLALGIGGTTAIFSVVQAVILRPLPFPDADRLVALWESNPERGWVHAQVAGANFLDWREQNESFQDVTAAEDWLSNVTLTGGREPESVNANWVVGNFFSVMGVPPELGRGFREEETWEGAERVVVLSHRLWQSAFGAEPGIVGRSISVNGVSRTVVGVMPERFRFPFEEVDIWLPIGWEPSIRQAVFFRRAHAYRVVGRLRDGVSREQAASELTAIASRLEQQYPETNRLMGAGLTPLHDWTVGETRLPLYLLLSAVALVLLIACVNVANLLLVRARDRSREVSIRAALGAGRSRILRQMLTESALLSLTGGALGILLGVWGTRALVALAPETIPRLDEVRPDATFFLFGLSVSLFTSLIFGLVPALHGSRPDLNETLKEGARTGTIGVRNLRAGHFLVMAEMALAVLLLVGAALLTRSFLRLKNIDPGFDARSALTFEVALPRVRYPEEHRVVAFFSELQQRLRTLPGVEAASATTRLPLIRRGWTSDFSVEGRPSDAYGIDVLHSEVGPDYFRTLGIPLLKGRAFEEGDGASSPTVVLINEALARRYFDGENPLGRKLCFDRNPDASSIWRTIVGVVGDVRQTGIRDEPRPEIFAPFAQDFSSRMTVIVRTTAEPRSHVGAARAEVQALDRDLAIFSIKTLDDVRSEVVAQDRFLLTLLAVFAAGAMLLATVGVYGVVSHAATRRTREIGIRMALGARAADVVRVVVSQGMAAALFGLAAGLLGALGLTHVLGGLLFEVRPTDPVSFAVVAFVLLAAAGLACYLPARRATRTDPAEVLRCE